MTERYVAFCSNGDDVRGVLKVVQEIASRLQCATGIVTVPTKRQFVDTIFGNALEQKTAKSLQDTKKTTVMGSVRFAGQTERDLKSWSKGDIVIAAYPTSRMLDEIDSMHDVKIVVAIDVSPTKQLNVWRASHSPAEIRGDGSISDTRPAPAAEPVILVALAFIWANINPSTGFAHSSDKELAQAVLWTLREAGQLPSPEFLKATAKSSGWAADAAEDLREEAKAIGERVRAPSIDAGVIKRFQAELDGAGVSLAS